MLVVVLFGAIKSLDVYKRAAERHAAGRVLSLLEGGYDMEGLAASVDEHVRALA